MGDKLIDVPSDLIGQQVTLHTSDGSFDGKVVFLEQMATVLFDEEHREIHVVFDTGLVGMTIHNVTGELLERVQSE